MGLERYKKIVKLSQVLEVYDLAKLPVHAVRSGVFRTLKKMTRRVDSGLRAKRMVRWLSLANGDVGQTYFFTATFADDVTGYDDALERWKKFRRIVLREFPELRYVAVPEVQPRSGRWHFHAVFVGLPGLDELRRRYGRRLSAGGRWVDAWQFAFTQLWSAANGSDRIHRAAIEPARSLAGVCSYLAKYLVKDVGGVVPAGRRNYYAGGKKLVRPKIEIHDDYAPSGEKVYQATYYDRLGNRVDFSRYTY